MNIASGDVTRTEDNAGHLYETPPVMGGQGHDPDDQAGCVVGLVVIAGGVLVTASVFWLLSWAFGGGQ